MTTNPDIFSESTFEKIILNPDIYLKFYNNINDLLKETMVNVDKNMLNTIDLIAILEMLKKRFTNNTQIIIENQNKDYTKFISNENNIIQTLLAFIENLTN